ncbi:MAG: hypothetical protein U0V02_19585 [Anaerolineales bacterium]
MKVNFNLILLLLFILVVGCQNSIPEPPTIISPTLPQLPTLTITPSSIPTLFLSFTPSANPYPTFPPYSTKQVIFSYIVYGSNSSFDMALKDGSPSSRIIIYSDGQLIISGKPYRQKQLSKEEINWLLSQLENMGFYSLETNQQHDTTDLLYDFKGQFEETYDGLYFCIADNIKNREVCIRDHLREFLIQPMKDILQFLDNYEPKNMSVYNADRLLLDIEARPPTWYIVDNPEVIPWSDVFPSIETDKWKLLYVDGDKAKQIFSLYGYQQDGRFVTFNGVKYYVIVRPVLPHEILSWLQ